MKTFIGIDVSLANSAFCVLDEHGWILAAFSHLFDIFNLRLPHAHFPDDHGNHATGLQFSPQDLTPSPGAGRTRRIGPFGADSAHRQAIGIIRHSYAWLRMPMLCTGRRLKG